MTAAMFTDEQSELSGFYVSHFQDRQEEQATVCSPQRGKRIVIECNVGIILSLSSEHCSASQWRPVGLLVAHLQEHQSAVQFLVPSADGKVSFFLCLIR